MPVRPRQLAEPLGRALARGKSALLLGPRQVGKSTLAAGLDAQIAVSFVQTGVRRRYDADPGVLTRELEALPRRHGLPPLVVLDEVQRWPDALDVAQDAIDRRLARFVLTGSSARRLTRGRTVNLLPGRVVALRLDPFTCAEEPGVPLDERLLDGALPGMRAAAGDDREADLDAYVDTYLEQEVRAEALVRNVGIFSQFLQLAAAESGRIVNMNKLGDDIGVSPPTIRAYFAILEDCLLLERIMPLATGSGRRRLVKSAKLLFFDLGVRRRAAGDARELTGDARGALFEQFVGLELLRGLRVRASRARLRFWRAYDGQEVDWVLERPERLVPVEVKWTDAPRPSDARHVERFCQEHPEAPQGFVVCRTPRPARLTERVRAIAWTELAEVHAALTAATS